MKGLLLKKKAYNKLMKVLYHLLPGGYSLPPFMISYDITFRCNLRCRMCPYYGEGAKPMKIEQEMTKQEIIRMLRSIKRAYRFVPYKPLFNISGGEPLLREDFFEIVAQMKRLGFKYILTSNFILLNDEKMKKLIRHNPQDILISMDGPEEYHDLQRKSAGAFKKTVENIRRFKELNRKKISITLGCTMTKHNLDHIEKVLEIAHDLGVGVRFLYLIMLPKGLVEAHKKATGKILGEKMEPWFYGSFEEDKLSTAQVEELARKVKRIKKRAVELGVPISFLPELEMGQIKRYHLDYSFRRNDICTYTHGAVRINSYGDVYPCMGFKYGNLKTEEFSEINNGSRMRKFRSALQEKGLFPGCVRCCKL